MGRPKSCNTCCHCVIGFDADKWADLVDCYEDNQEIISHIANDISRINECCLVYAGNSSDFCNEDSIQFQEVTWPKVKSWIENGGRLFLATEYEGCLGDPEQLAKFLIAMDSTIVWEGGIFAPNCGQILIPGNANISKNITTAKMAATAKMSGGDAVVFKTLGGITAMVVEALGNGFLFVVGDGNLWIGCDYTNCELALALRDTKDEDIV